MLSLPLDFLFVRFFIVRILFAEHKLPSPPCAGTFFMTHKEADAVYVPAHCRDHYRFG